MKYIIIILVILLNILQIAFSQNKLLIAMDDLNTETFKDLKSKNVSELKVIYGADIYPNNPIEVDLGKLEKAIILAFPRSDQSGYGMLDWEGKGYHELIHAKGRTQDFVNIQNQFIKTIKFAKKLRPNVKWGFFEIPARERRFKSRALQLDSHERISVLLDACDVFYPSMYGYTPEDLGSLSDVLFALELGKKFNKEVYPMVWHRFQGDTKNQTKKYWFEIIPKKMFSERIKEIRSINNNNNRINGIVWWGKDTYFYIKKNKVVRSESRNISSFKSKYNLMVKDYVKFIQKK
ncbi:MULTISPECIES: hypothetical protein [unclassified Sphingobacterium]|uniref:hypothetical protein n=1 Tax=unclassified Sphingobacterium TaxID=2609468 RepID=UPI001048DFC9|nr:MULTISPECIES: hypothetical protein [unclassified Sphingobacterium]MCS3555843.1 hypothetical protein [Sphingobacterium sp. JUb21]TCR00704.1 hypothetical protein EDF66_11113 [Sphingobacterium sp. JUb20]